MKFTEFCKANNIQLLREDMKFLRKHVKDLDDDLRKLVLMNYAQLWISHLEFNQNSSQAQNIARKQSNLWLLQESAKLKFSNKDN